MLYQTLLICKVCYQGFLCSSRCAFLLNVFYFWDHSDLPFPSIILIIRIKVSHHLTQTTGNIFTRYIIIFYIFILNHYSGMILCVLLFLLFPNAFPNFLQVGMCKCCNEAILHVSAGSPSDLFNGIIIKLLSTATSYNFLY